MTSLEAALGCGCEGAALTSLVAHILPAFHLGAAVLSTGTRVGASAELQREIPAHPDTVNLEFVGLGSALGLRPRSFFIMQ